MCYKSQNQTHVLTKVYPKSHLFSTLRIPDELIGVQIDSIRSLSKYNLVTDGNNKFNFGSHGDLQKQIKTHPRPTVDDCVKIYCTQNILVSISRQRSILLLTRDVNNCIVPTFR